MNKRKLLLVNLLISFFIILGYIGTIYMDTNSYQKLVTEHVESIIRLSSSNISSEIENTLTKPIFVAKTMANDTFLKDWLRYESKDSEASYEQKLIDYLNAYYKKYQYDSIFLISQKTGMYYYQDGIYKTLSSKNEQDTWYYEFINSNLEYDLEIDSDATDDNTATVFINFRIEDSDGLLMGIVGVGLKTSRIHNALKSYESTYNLQAYLVSDNQISRIYTKDSSDNFLLQEDLDQTLNIQGAVPLIRDQKLHLDWYSDMKKSTCLITKYEPNLKMFLLLKKNTSSMYALLMSRIQHNLIFIIIMLASSLFIISLVFLQYHKKVIEAANTDNLTNLPNYNQFQILLKKPEKYIDGTLFIFDLDGFKQVNDSRGHLFGNHILSLVGEISRNEIYPDGLIFRWGGDEFVGILYSYVSNPKAVFKRIMEKLSNEEEGLSYKITISVGMISIEPNNTMEELLRKADKALYTSKINGRNRITFCDKDL